MRAELRQKVETNSEPRALLLGLCDAVRDAEGRSGNWGRAQCRDYRCSKGIGTMPTMRMPWSKSGNLQLDLLDTPTVSEAAPSPPAAPSATARSASMVPTASLFEDASNPRTEIPEAEIDELANDIRLHGILQPIVVHPADDAGRHQIHFGAKRWRAAQRIGLLEVPVIVRDGPANPYAQVAENQKRHGLTSLDLARFIRGRIDAGDSNTTVAKTLGLDLTTVAHHLALLDLPPVVDAAMKARRCSSPRTLYELGKLHAEQPERVALEAACLDPHYRVVEDLRIAAVQFPGAEEGTPVDEGDDFGQGNVAILPRAQEFRPRNIDPGPVPLRTPGARGLE